MANGQSRMVKKPFATPHSPFTLGASSTRSGSRRQRPMPWRPAFPRLVNAVPTIPAGMRAAGAVHLSPGPRGCLIQYGRRLLRRDVMAPSASHVQTAGAWKEGEMARDPGGPLRPFPGEASAMAPSRRPPRGTWPPCLLVSDPQGPHLAVGRSLQRCPKSPPTRVPKGNPLRRAKALHWLRSRRPAYPSHPRRCCRRGWWCWERGENVERGQSPGHCGGAESSWRPGV